jgi:LmbE family N-acetylglucosaminyl deacetylase
MSGPAIFDRLAIVMAHPDDEVLWACSALRAAEKIVLVFGELKGSRTLTEGRKVAMADFPLPTLEWLQMVETGVFDSASWPTPRETEYGVYPHRALKLLSSFDPERYRRQFGEMRDRLRVSLKGMKNVIAHGPWGEYGHEDHIQVFRVVASLAGEMGFRLWVPGYYAPKSEALMHRNLRFLGRPTEPLPIDAALAKEIAQIYKRTKTWTWFPDYVWPATERFFPWHDGGAPAGQAARADEIALIRFPADYEATRRSQLRWRRESVRKVLAWLNGRKAG